MSRTCVSWVLGEYPLRRLVAAGVLGCVAAYQPILVLCYHRHHRGVTERVLSCERNHVWFVVCCETHDCLVAAIGVVGDT